MDDDTDRKLSEIAERLHRIVEEFDKLITENAKRKEPPPK